MPTITTTESCISLWEKQLEDAANQLAVKNAEYNQQNAACQDLGNWILLLQECLENLDTTDDKRAEIIKVLDLFVSQAESVCENVTCLKEGIEILYCDVIQTSRCVEELHDKVLCLRSDIDSIQTKLTTDNSEFLKCLTTLQVQIEKVLEFYSDMVNQILDTAATVYSIECFLCNNETGLLKKLNELIAYFGGEVDEDYCTHDSTPGQEASSDCNILCKEKLETPEFPLADTEFYKEIQVKLTKAESDQETCLKDLEEITKEKDKLNACKNSLEKAIDEATKASEGK